MVGRPWRNPEKQGVARRDVQVVGTCKEGSWPELGWNKNRRGSWVGDGKGRGVVVVLWSAAEGRPVKGDGELLFGGDARRKPAKAVGFLCGRRIRRVRWLGVVC
jgi:hypothetical protein